MRKWIAVALVTGACTLGTGGAVAQQCVGFGDVAQADPFCPFVEWMKNRGVTLGCAAALYCPGDGVSRLSMAAFMQRLGKALSPEIHKDHVTLFGAAIPGEPPAPVLFTCEMAGDSSVTVHPRKALLNATVSGLADANSVAWRAFWLYSTDGGATFQTIMDGSSPISSPRASSAANQWSGLALAFALDLPANTPLQVRVGVRRDNILIGTIGNFADVRCQMAVSIVNANGTSSPL